jgi:Uma2 family endonuclease
MSAVSAPSRLLTAEEFFRLNDGRHSELVRGVVVPMNQPGFRHGKVCSRIDRRVGNFVEEHDLGHTLSNDSGIITERDPDTVRGADVSFYSYGRVPKGTDPIGYPSAVPELVFEVVSPGNTWSEIHAKVREYLVAGVNVVTVLDPGPKTAHDYRPDGTGVELEGDSELLYADLPGFSLPVRMLFE